MTQIPLSTADFCYAYPHAVEALLQAPSFQQPTLKHYRDCADVGLQAVRELRRIQRLPAGAGKLHKRLIDALKVRDKRDLRRRRPAGHEIPFWDLPLADRIKRTVARRVISLFRCRGLDKAYGYAPQHEMHVVAIDNPGRHVKVSSGATSARPGVSSPLNIWLHPKDWMHAYVRGVAVVEKKFVLSASPVEDIDLPIGVAALWDVRWLKVSIFQAAKNHDSYGGNQLSIERGVVVQDTDGRARFATRQSAYAGALAEFRAQRRGRAHELHTTGRLEPFYNTH